MINYTTIAGYLFFISNTNNNVPAIRYFHARTGFFTFRKNKKQLNYFTKKTQNQTKQYREGDLPAGRKSPGGER
jgi:hypothetical protein